MESFMICMILAISIGTVRRVPQLQVIQVNPLKED